MCVCKNPFTDAQISYKKNETFFFTDGQHLSNKSNLLRWTCLCRLWDWVELLCSSSCSAGRSNAVLREQLKRDWLHSWAEPEAGSWGWLQPVHLRRSCRSRVAATGTWSVEGMKKSEFVVVALLLRVSAHLFFRAFVFFLLKTEEEMESDELLWSWSEAGRVLKSTSAASRESTVVLITASVTFLFSLPGWETLDNHSELPNALVSLSSRLWGVFCFHHFIC